MPLLFDSDVIQISLKDTANANIYLCIFTCLTIEIRCVNINQTEEIISNSVLHNCFARNYSKDPSAIT